MRSKVLLSATLAVAFLITGGTAAAFAADDVSAAYGYHTGQQQHAQRQERFQKATEMTDADREAYFQSQGIGDENGKQRGKLDVEAMVEAGVIDQATADRIAAYAASKHEQIGNRYAGMDELTAEERHTRYATSKTDRFAGNTVEELLEADVITQVQADAMQEYLQ